MDCGLCAIYYSVDAGKSKLWFIWLVVRCLEETQSDYVIFSNFNVDLVDRKMSPLCGSHVMTGNTFVISDGNFFRVSFKSNDVYDAIGFSAHYTFVHQLQGI